MSKELTSKYIELSATAIERLAKVKAANDRAAQQAATAAQGVLPVLKGLLNPAEFKTASAMLQSHESTISLLRALATKVASLSQPAKTVAEPGRPVDATDKAPKKQAFDAGWSVDADEEYRANLRK